MQSIPDDGIAEESDDEEDKPRSADQRISSKFSMTPERFPASKAN